MGDGGVVTFHMYKESGFESRVRKNSTDRTGRGQRSKAGHGHSGCLFAHTKHCNGTEIKYRKGTDCTV